MKQVLVKRNSKGGLQNEEKQETDNHKKADSGAKKKGESVCSIPTQFI